MTTKSTPCQSILNFSDPELPWLATMAALDLELMKSGVSLGNNREENSIELMKLMFLNSFQSDSMADISGPTNMDKLTVSLVGKALSNVSEIEPRLNYNEFLSECKQVTKKFEKYHLHTEELRDFLLRLADFSNEFNNQELSED